MNKIEKQASRHNITNLTVIGIVGLTFVGSMIACKVSAGCNNGPYTSGNPNEHSGHCVNGDGDFAVDDCCWLKGKK